MFWDGTRWIDQRRPNRPTPALAPRGPHDWIATGLIFLRVHPRIDAIRKDPRYPALLARLGL